MVLEILIWVGCGHACLSQTNLNMRVFFNIQKPSGVIQHTVYRYRRSDDNQQANLIEAHKITNSLAGPNLETAHKRSFCRRKAIIKAQKLAAGSSLQQLMWVLMFYKQISIALSSCISSLKSPNKKSYSIN